MNLRNKKVLLFIPNGKGVYGTAVKAEMEGRGATVAIYDERPSTGTASKIAVRLAKNHLEPIFRRYLSKIVEENKDVTFDYVIVIRAEAFTPKSMEFLKHANPHSNFILYLWDSIDNTDTSPLFPYFDKILSFDKQDCEKYHLVHRPLFFINCYREVAGKPSTDIDVLFVAKMHSDRFLFAKNYEKELLKNGFSTYFFFYLQSRLVFLKMKLENRSLKDAKVSDINYKPLSASAVANLMQRSRVSLDAQHPAQTGLTMRTLEVFGSKRKLITTNSDIKNYDFYHPQNIMVVKRNEVIVDSEFIKSPFYNIPNSIYEKYSLQGWLDDLISI